VGFGAWRVVVVVGDVGCAGGVYVLEDGVE
jgi:hypothetical protein